MKKILVLWLIFTLSYLFVQSAPATISKYIKLDQFGYCPISKKIAVVVDPQVGYNADESFTPGTGVNQYQVRRWSNDAVVFSGTLAVWNSGATHDQSGDKGWWFDFSTLETVGSYYIYDVANNVGSYRFEIGSDVYNQVLKHAVRMLFYQRINYAKQPPYVEARWADAACFEGANQDRNALLFNSATGTIGDASTARDVHGGWMDAGDYNKYTTFSYDFLCDLLETYRQHPAVFLDNYNLPKSGNGIADLLDEIIWELDWLKRMQNATGTNGLALKVGVITDENWIPPSSASPPSKDANPRYYIGECTSATLSGAAVFALASIVYRSLGNPDMDAYGEELLMRAQNAWNRAKLVTNNFETSFLQADCDVQRVNKQPYMYAGNADKSKGEQIDALVTAAVYLYEATGIEEYRTVVDTTYAKSSPINLYWWGPDYGAIQAALLRYTTLPGATATVVNTIRTRKADENDISSVDDYNASTDLYRAYMPSDHWRWGSNRDIGYAGIHNFDFATYAISSSHPYSLYKEVGESYLHWLHGVNPMGIVMLSNMYAYGGDSCVNEIYHAWFAHGTNWDNAKSSLYGPAPGYLTGGPNIRYGIDYGISSYSPPYNQPPQKAYKDWNTSWNATLGAEEAAWSITEPSIHNQAVYISLLARVIASHIGEVPLPLHFSNLTVRSTPKGAQLDWVVSETVNLQHFSIERSFDGRHFSALAQVPVQSNQLTYSFIDEEVKATAKTVYYRIKAVYPTEVIVSTIRKISAQTRFEFTVSPNPATRAVWVNSGVVEESPVAIEVMNANGAVLHKEQWVQAKGEFSKYVSLEKLPAGTYWIRMLLPNEQKTQRIVKQ